MHTVIKLASFSTCNLAFPKMYFLNLQVRASVLTDSSPKNENDDRVLGWTIPLIAEYYYKLLSSF